jgi:hypothetical protein
VVADRIRLKIEREDSVGMKKRSCWVARKVRYCTSLSTMLTIRKL